MKTTFRLMGVADWITLGNGLLGTFSIACLIHAFDGFSNVDANSEKYIWLAMLFIVLSIFGDLIDGPIARSYSKRRYLGSYLDLMSDSISFGVAPALLVFGLFSQWGENTPVWTISVGVVCCWVIICTLLRLARFQHESDSENRWFHGLASPGSAVLILSISGLILLQPEVVSYDFVNFMGGDGSNYPFAWLIFPGMIIPGTLMISDRRLPKFSKGTGMNLSLLLLLSMFTATLIQSTTQNSSSGAVISFSLFMFSLAVISLHVLMGPKICDSMFESNNSES
jgi:phosphatidylserine synthase